MLPVVGHVLGLRETLRVRAAMANVALTLMKYTYQGSTLAVFRYPENPRFPDGIPDSPEQ